MTMTPDQARTVAEDAHRFPYLAEARRATALVYFGFCPNVSGRIATRCMLRALRDYETRRGDATLPHPSALQYADEWLEPELVAAYESARPAARAKALSLGDRLAIAPFKGPKCYRRTVARAYASPGRRFPVRTDEQGTPQ